ncbi:MAG: hypothetical protein AB2L14_13570 [Candidatus Xenobiia bacterium LiM19]
MNIPNISNYNISPLPQEVLHPSRNTEGSAVSADAYVAGRTQGLTREVKWNGSSLPFGISRVKEIRQPVEKPFQGRVISLTEDSINDLTPAEDGGYRVEQETGTTSYYGPAAKNYLDRTTFFDKETEVIIPRGGSLEVTYNGQSLHIAEPGAVLIGAGTEAKVNLCNGDVLVITTERAPSWYKKFGAEGEHNGEFEKITRLNQKLFACLTHQSRIGEGSMRRLLDYGLVTRDKEDGAYVRWDPSINDHDLLRSRLIEAGFQGAEMDEMDKVWENTIKRKLYGLESGRLSKNLFPPKVGERLMQNGIIGGNRFDPDTVYWKTYSTENELRSSLSRAGFDSGEAENIVKTWRETTKSGYDNTGLVWDKGKVVSYLHREKINIWNEQDTEWIVNSTEYAGEMDPFTVGVSIVQARKPVTEPHPFKEIRPAETLHRHPHREDRKQTEVYMATNGSAALLSIRKGKPHVTYLNKGDMAVINAGVSHCVLAFNGSYEHLCFQVPSAFQYGFLFKDQQEYGSYGLDEAAILREAMKGLEKGKSGTVEVQGR